MNDHPNGGRLEWLQARLPILLELAGVTRQVILHASPDQVPGTPQRHAWVLPAEQLALGPGGTAAIVFYLPSLASLPQKKLLEILAHEVGHVKRDYDAILRCEKVSCGKAEAEGRWLLRSRLEDLLMEKA